MIVENSPVSSSKNNGTVGRVSARHGSNVAQFTGRKWMAKLQAVHSILPRIAERARFLCTRFEVGRDGKTAHERLEGKSAKVQVLMFGEGVSWKWKRRGSPLGKLTRMWEDGVCLGVKGTTGDIIVGTRRRVVHEDGQEKAREKDCGSSWRMNEDDPETDGVKLQEEIEITDKDHKEKFSFPSTTRSWGN